MPKQEKNFFMKLAEDIDRILEGRMRAPLTVSVMGQTGVGKSTLVNELFDTDLPTDPVRPGTGSVESIQIKAKNGYIVAFNDLPGVGESLYSFGESNNKDEIWIPQYRKFLQDSDVVIWAVSAENRAFRYDQETLSKLMEGLEEEEKIGLASKIVFALTKVDILTDFKNPTGWFLKRIDEDKDQGIFTPNFNLLKLIEEKEDYFQDRFLAPFAHLIQVKVHSRERIKKDIPHNMNYEGNFACYKGILKRDEYHRLCKEHPRQKSVFSQIFASTQVISCSALHRYHLNLLMYAVVSKLSNSSVGRFKGFANNVSLDKVTYSKSERYNNIVRI